MMTKQQVREQLERHLLEYCEGFIFVGQIVGSPEIVMSAYALDTASTERLLRSAHLLVEAAAEKLACDRRSTKQP
jgi:hypothetical protein